MKKMICFEMNTAKSDIKKKRDERGFLIFKSDTPLTPLVRQTCFTSPETRIQKVKEIMKDLSAMEGIVIVQDGTPLGLLMNYELDRHLGTRYGVSLYYGRKVSTIADREPLIVEVSQSVEEVARAAMARDDKKIYDDIIAVEEGRFVGTISVRNMLDYMAEIQLKIAMGANPLSGLPGNVAIEQEINRRAADKCASS